MQNIVEQHNNAGAVRVEFEIDLTTDGAITATRGRGVSCVRSEAGKYVATVTNQVFYEVLQRNAVLSEATPTKAWVAITAVDVNGAGDGTGATISFWTLDDNATPTAADLTAGTISVSVLFGTFNPAP